MLKVQILMQGEDEQSLIAAFRDAIESIQHKPDVVMQLCMGLRQLDDTGQVKSRTLLSLAGDYAETAARKMENPYKLLALDTAARLKAGSGNYDKGLHSRRKQLNWPIHRFGLVWNQYSRRWKKLLPMLTRKSANKSLAI